MAKRCPVTPRIRSAVSKVGDTRPCSYADKVDRDVPARAASSVFDSPAASRTSVIRPMLKAYQIRYVHTRDPVTKSGHEVTRVSSLGRRTKCAHVAAIEQHHDEWTITVATAAGVLVGRGDMAALLADRHNPAFPSALMTSRPETTGRVERRGRPERIGTRPWTSLCTRSRIPRPHAIAMPFWCRRSDYQPK